MSYISLSKRNFPKRRVIAHNVDDRQFQQIWLDSSSQKQNRFRSLQSFTKHIGRKQTKDVMGRQRKGIL